LGATLIVRAFENTVHDAAIVSFSLDNSGMDKISGIINFIKKKFWHAIFPDRQKLS
jgi:hypothetical protein